MNDAVATDKDKEKNRIEISPGASVSISRGSTSSDERRRLVAAGDSTGKHILLVVRVTDNTGDAPSKKASELSVDVFSDPNNLVSGILSGLAMFVPTGLIMSLSLLSRPISDLSTVLALVANLTLLQQRALVSIKVCWNCAFQTK
jgi:hypothetical protein